MGVGRDIKFLFRPFSEDFPEDCRKACKNFRIFPRHFRILPKTIKTKSFFRMRILVIQGSFMYTEGKRNSFS